MVTSLLENSETFVAVQIVWKLNKAVVLMKGLAQNVLNYLTQWHFILGYENYDLLFVFLQEKFQLLMQDWCVLCGGICSLCYMYFCACFMLPENGIP